MNDRILRWRDIHQLTQMSRWTIQRWEEQGHFPKRFNITPGSGSVGWYESEVTEWLANRRQESSAS